MRPVGPDGRPVERTRYFRQAGDPGMATASLARSSRSSIVTPGKPERVLIFNADRKLSAFVDIKGDEPDPIRVVLRPSGTVTGRLVDEDGRPRPNVRLEVEYRVSNSESAEQEFSPPVMTGPDGRFRIEGLIPGLSYTVAVLRRGERDERRRYEGNLYRDEWTLKPGEVVRLGRCAGEAPRIGCRLCPCQGHQGSR